MELSLFEQAGNIIAKSKTVLIVLPPQSSLDAIAGALALRFYLMPLGKTVYIVSSDPVPVQLSFLPGASEVLDFLPGFGQLTIVLNTEKTKLSELSYETHEKDASIFLKAKTGQFTAEDVTVKTSPAGFDAIFIIGAQSYEHLGNIFTQHANSFYEVPRVVVDISPKNEYFGTVNIVDVTASAITEVLFHLITVIKLTEISKDTATALLAGIIANTGSFQSIVTTPRCLSAGAELVNLGAAQQEIIQHLFKNKELPLLKLWGRALARFKAAEDFNFAYAVVTMADFDKTATSVVHAAPVLQELLDNISGFKVFAVLAELEGAVDVLVTTHPELRAGLFFESLGYAAVPLHTLSGGVQYFRVRIPGSLSEVETIFTSSLRQAMPQRKAM